ncbi:hypothetical protein BJX76DRAFT_16712 [Aspergillus varians]
MPADYASTARALSLSTSSSRSPSPLGDATRPPWSQTATDTRNNTVFSTRRATPAPKQGTMAWINAMKDRILTAWQKMTFWQRVGSVLAVIGINVVAFGFLYITGRVFHWLEPVAAKWEHSGTAYFLLWLGVFFVSFPPLIGWSTFGTVSGYIFGVWKGWLLYASATVIGSTCSFIASRTILASFVQRLTERDTRFAALALTLKYDGLKLLCMVRLCPLPYSICNGAISTFPTVQPLMYGLATAIISPKLLIPVFVGSRLRLLYEKDVEMSTATKLVNVFGIIITAGVGGFTGWYIYKRTMARAKELEDRERDDLRDSLLADHAPNRAQHSFSDDPNANGAAKFSARDEEERIGFDDDNVDLVIDDDDDRSPIRSKSPYRDEFTDNESDVFRDGDGPDGETYTLHTRRE